ncbi:DUF3592 domain-containing protein [Actinomadura algeriensis]|uniref:DUF3592 domain-containing protein n=1 Tax=Actinomadura algeriensis TaxID=1679523 RepID=A0ABR9JZU3_9ACTN|nr:DUF3592 domain-containing protein [Actinomadura algeriensis]MBE1536090.1 hypothetical protein [Actinomadura algeriensis]
MDALLVFLGMLFLFAFWAVLQRHVRIRTRGRRTIGVIVGHKAIKDSDTGTTYAAIFRFGTEDGRTVEAVSTLSTSWRRGVGREVPLIYDPADPEGTADRPGTHRLDLVFIPMLLVCGAGLTIYGVDRLLF